MSIKDLSKDELELFSYKDLTDMLLKEQGAKNTADLFKEIVDLLGLPNSVYENKISDYYTTLTTDKRFVMLEDGKWDLRDNHTSDKVVIVHDADDEEDEEEMDNEEAVKEEEEDLETDFDSSSNDDDFDDTDDDLKDLVVYDEDELELEE